MSRANFATQTTVYLGLGANLGDRLASLTAAVQALDQTDGIRVDWADGIAPVYETEPVGGPPGQPHYLNSAIRIFTNLKPFELLAETQRIEQQLGRERTERWAARTIDIDILLFGDQMIETDTLTIPHPLMHERSFVLAPLGNIAPDVRHPVHDRQIHELVRSSNLAEVAIGFALHKTKSWHRAHSSPAGS